MDATTYQDYVNILHEELVPAMGCTEPIAIAYAAAVARQTLGRPAQRMEVEASGNIIKNVKSVFVPNTGGLRGIPAAAAAGMAAGDPALELEVLSSIGEGEQAAIRQYLADTPIAVKLADSPFIFDIVIRAWAGEDSALVRIVNYHTNIVRVERNGQVLKEVEAQAAAEEGLTDKSVLTVEGILEFAREAALADVEEAVGRQVRYNTAIAQEGLRGDYGANIGKVLLATYGDDVKIRAKAMAAAGSDARMNGCGLPVVIVSGSGNQGLTASLPVVEYAKELGADWETTLRAVLVSDLITIHLKAEIGRLSAYCGAVSAGCGSGAGIAWLYGREKEPQALLKDVSHTIVNALAVDSGIVCDGAKASCAAKIASAVDAGLLGFYMYQNGQQFRGGDGIISKGVEETIRNIGLLATQGMRETDREILDIMTTRC
ncbi:MAG: serine dehydratase subunit alpha family protein [Acutalibacter sp.]